jgi:magnesium-transporting ATPase (P-type)
LEVDPIKVDIAMANTAVQTISIDESPLTGETNPIKKNVSNPLLFSGCQVNDGSGIMLVTCVGSSSSAGRIQAMLNESQGEETTLQKKLKVLAVQIGVLGLASGILTFLGLLVRWIIEISNHPFDSRDLIKLVDFFVTGVTLIGNKGIPK